MNSEEMERAIAFLLDNQAKHDANQSKLEANLVGHDERLAKLEELTEANTRAIAALTGEMREGFDALTSSMQRLTDTMTLLGVSQIEIKRRVERLESGAAD